MSLRSLSRLLPFAACLGAALATSNDARACGGCFSGGGEPTVVTAHRMALSISLDRTVLWDQIQYQGQPEEFAWVLPVRGGATIELASDAFFEALDAATSVNVFPPQGVVCEPTYPEQDYPYDDYGGGYGYGACSMTGCAASDDRGAYDDGEGSGGGGGVGEPEPPPPVEVVHQESIGPYEAVVLSSNQPGALYDWLLSHGYAVDASMEPVIDGYEAEGFDFVGLRLIPGANTQQMRPVRVTTPGAAPVLPLKMVAAGAGTNVGMTLFVLGEGRWEADSHPNGRVNPAHLRWDYATSSSNYADTRSRTMGLHDGASWVTTYAKQGALLSGAYNQVAMGNTGYLASNGYQVSTIGQLYAYQGQANGESVNLDCMNAMGAYAMSYAKVVDPCAQGSGGSGVGGSGVGGSGAGGAGGATTGAGAGGAGGAGGGNGGAGNGGGANGGGGAGTGAGGGAGGGNGGAGATGGAGSGGAGNGGAGNGGAGAGASDGAGGSGNGSGGAGGSGEGVGAAGAGGSTTGTGSGSGGAGGSDEEEPQCMGPTGPDEIDYRMLVCGDLDDVGVALVGMHPVNVWVTRLEANLPKSALSYDLSLRAASDQAYVDNWIFSGGYTGDPCAPGGVVASPAPPKKERPRPPFGSVDMAALGLTLAFFLGAAARRQLRPRVARA